MAIIYIVDIETTGLNGGPRDLVVDIGICSFDTSTKKVEDVYSSHLGYDTSAWGEDKRNAWIFSHEGSELAVEEVDVANGCPPAEKVIEEVRDLLNGKTVTSYNTPFDLYKFLLRDPWYLNVVVAPDILQYARSYLHSRFWDARDAKLQTAYDWILGNTDPAGINGLEKHLGLPDARMAAHVMKKMWNENYYRL